MHFHVLFNIAGVAQNMTLCFFPGTFVTCLVRGSTSSALGPSILALLLTSMSSLAAAVLSGPVASEDTCSVLCGCSCCRLTC